MNSIFLSRRCLGQSQHLVAACSGHLSEMDEGWYFFLHHGCFNHLPSSSSWYFPLAEHVHISKHPVPFLLISVRVGFVCRA